MRPTRERLLRKGDYVHGSFVKPESVDGYINAVNPGDRSDVLGRFPFSVRNVDEAVESAAIGARAWRRVGLMERAAAVRRFREQFGRHQDDAAHLLTRETGKPLWEARQEATAAIRSVDLFLDDGLGLIAPRVIEEIGGRADYVPRGVVGVVNPYVMPLLQAVQTTVAAVMGGNAVVMKPSKFTPAVGQHVAEMWDRCKLPRGVVNMVHGSGSVVGQKLVAHHGLDALVFAGGYDTARDIRRALIDRPEAPVLLQCGGKGIAIVLDDAEIDRAVYEVLVGACLSTGQRPNTTARVIVTAKIYEKFAGELVRRAQRITVGYGLTPDTFMGPLISENARLRFRKYCRAVVSKGHSPLLEGDAVDVPNYRGNYVRPGIYRVHWENGLAFLNDEPPGPILLVYRVKDVEEAVNVHNRAMYRPVTSVFTRLESPALVELRDTLRTGAINVNRATVGASMRLPSVAQGRSANGLAGGMELMRMMTYPRASLVETRAFDSSQLVPGVSWHDEETSEEPESVMELAVE